MAVVAGFLPSTSGLHFLNSFAHVPLETVEVPLLGLRVPIGDAANGLCGGMVYTVKDYFEHRQTPPPTTTPPQDGPLYDYLVRRLFESWDIPRGIARYFYLMSPQLPDYGPVGGVLGFASHSRASVIIRDEWPTIRDDLDNNRPSPLGLIECKSDDPVLLGRNHQVLAYGYDLQGTDLTLRIYDPNAPDDDAATISLSVAGPDRSCQLACTTIPTLYCLFRTHYTPAGPPPEGTPWASSP